MGRGTKSEVLYHKTRDADEAHSIQSMFLQSRHSPVQTEAMMCKRMATALGYQGLGQSSDGHVSYPFEQQLIESRSRVFVTDIRLLANERDFDPLLAAVKNSGVRFEN